MHARIRCDLFPAASLFDETRALFEIAAQRTTTSHEKAITEDLLARGDAHRDRADAIRTAHLERVQGGSCDALAGLTFSDMVVALRRIKNHSINMVEAHNSSWQSRLEALEVLDGAKAVVVSK